MKTNAIRTLLAIEAASFATAALVHFGVLTHGYEHRKAGIAESTIGTVLLIALALTFLRPASSRRIGRFAQGFALFGTFVGIFTIVIGIGPRTTPDLAYHVVIVAVLLFGLLRS